MWHNYYKWCMKLVLWLDVPLVYPRSQAFPPSSFWSLAGLQYCKQSKAGWWEDLGMTLPLVMVKRLVCLGIFWWCSVRTSYLRQRSEVKASCNFLQSAQCSRSALYGRFYFICNRNCTLHLKDCMEPFPWKSSHCDLWTCTQNDCGFNQRMYTHLFSNGKCI